MNLRFVVLVVVLIGLPTVVIAQDDWCAGVSSPNNPYNCCDNGNGAEGNCIWWSWHMRPDLPAWQGNAYVWYDYRDDTDPLVGSIICMPNMAGGLGHVAYVQWVNTDGSVEVSEMNCWTGLNGVRYRHYDVTGTRGFIYGGPVPFYEQCSPEGAINWRESHLLTESNPYSGHTASHQLLTAFGARNQYGIHWYHAYDPGNLYRGGNVPNNCYVQNWGLANGLITNSTLYYSCNVK